MSLANLGPGRYNDVVTEIRQRLNAAGVLLVVVDGIHGHGAPCQFTPEAKQLIIPFLHRVAELMAADAGAPTDEDHLTVSPVPTAAPVPPADAAAPTGLAIAAEWQTYFRQVLPDEASAIQIQETRRAFYAAALSMFNLIQSFTGLPGADAFRHLDALKTELAQFVAAIQKGQA